MGLRLIVAATPFTLRSIRPSMHAYPEWLHILAWVSLVFAFLCSLIVVIDIARGHRQKMAVMDLVWPISALYFGPLGVYAYFRVGRAMSSSRSDASHGPNHGLPLEEPTPLQTAVSTSHCGAGCVLGDIAAEWLVFATGMTVAGSVLLAHFAIDMVFAWLIGIAFQFFSIVPMKKLSFGQGLKAAIKADTISILAFQAGMMVWMAVYQLLIFHEQLRVNEAVWWFMMQIAMVLGFAASFPANIWLLKKGWKEKMPKWQTVRMILTAEDKRAA